MICGRHAFCICLLQIPQFFAAGNDLSFSIFDIQFFKMSNVKKLFLFFICSEIFIFLFLWFTNWRLFKGSFMEPVKIADSIIYREKISGLAIRDILQNVVQISSAGWLVLSLIFLVLPALLTLGYYDYFLKKKKSTSR